MLLDDPITDLDRVQICPGFEDILRSNPDVLCLSNGQIYKFVRHDR